MALVRRTICFVTGTRAEYGLMRSTLRAIAAHPKLKLQIVATGSHFDASRGRTIRQIEADGFPIAAAVPWKQTDGPAGIAAATGRAMAELAGAFERLQPDVVLVAGDRVEAFAAAAAAHVSQRLVAHVHGGDRAIGQVDDALRHAITKLAHLHFPATRQSAARIMKLGEQAWRVRRVGTPGVDGIREDAARWTGVVKAFPQLERRRYALAVVHPTSADDAGERRRADLVANAIVASELPRAVVILPNNDAGGGGIVRAWRDRAGDARFICQTDVPRNVFLALMRDSAVMIGNSSSGIIEAASFGTRVIDIGDRQLGRERGGNVTHVDFDAAKLTKAIRAQWRAGRHGPLKPANIYGAGGAGWKIAQCLAAIELNDRFRRKLIAY